MNFLRAEGGRRYASMRAGREGPRTPDFGEEGLHGIQMLQ